jgi:hypothetical protein
MGGLEVREIKYRAWEKSLKQMIPVDNIDFEKRMINTESAWRMFDEIQLMQYTGIKDKNDKEIYEGDVIHCDGYLNLYAVWDEENARFAFLCTDWVVTQGQPIRPHISSYYIIGNIYENPELIGGQTN